MDSRPETLCVHAGTYRDPEGGITTPIFASTAYAFPHPTGQVVYPRYFNVPNQDAVARKLAALEKGEAALVFGSGMAAISTAVLGILRAGDHAVFPRDIYGGTYALAARELPRFGIEVSFLAGNRLEDFQAAARPNTRLVYLESPSNPLLRITDLRAVAAWARSRGMATLIDNTFATPLNQTPLELGVDLVAHSATKYLNGHTDVNAGALVGSSDRISALRDCAARLGGMLDPRGAWLLERGLKTLALRVERQNRNALELASFLAGHSKVKAVHYPGLSSHPDHRLAAAQMRGFGGMLAFSLREASTVPSFLSRLEVIAPAISLGGVESVIVQPAGSSHAGLPPGERAALGITDDLLRLSVGIEAREDLERDLDRALGAA